MMVEEADESLGAILDALIETNELDNTYVFLRRTMAVASVVVTKPVIVSRDLCRKGSVQRLKAGFASLLWCPDLESSPDPNAMFPSCNGTCFLRCKIYPAIRCRFRTESMVEACERCFRMAIEERFNAPPLV